MERESRTLSTAGDTDDVLKVEKGARNKKTEQRIWRTTICQTAGGLQKFNAIGL